MTDEPERKCDPEDIICQMTVLSHLKGLKSALGEDRFKTDFPELQGLDERITSRESELLEALGKCGLEPGIEVEKTNTEEGKGE